jgi:NAD(P)H dehydrogenase (quinone)
MTTLVTGASGQLGRLVVESLLNRGVAPDQVVATARNVDSVADLAARGVQVRQADYDDPASLDHAFAGVDRLLLVSASEAGKRHQQHSNAIAAAKNAGVRLVAYTSIAHADTSSLLLAEEHLATEQELVASGVPAVLLRNSWYLENYTAQLETYLAHGVAGSAGTGRVSAASRRDYAEAAATVLVDDGHAGRTYELGGEAFTLTDLAGAISAATGHTVTYTDLPVEQFEQVLLGAGLPAPMAHILADADRGLAQGDLYVQGNDLDKLIGRRPDTLSDALTSAAQQLTT